MVNPYVDVERLSFDAGTEVFPRVRAAVTRIEDSRVDTIQYRRNEVTVTRNVLGLITFGSAVAAGVSAAYGAHADTTLGFGLGAATSYTGGTLYASVEKSALYEAANKALRCCAQTGHQAVATAEKIARQAAVYETTRNDVRDLIELCKQETLEEVNGQTPAAVLGAYEGSLLRLQAFANLDPVAAERLVSASDAIVEALNSELGKIAPSLDTILNAARSVGPLAVSFPGAVRQKKEDGDDAVPPAAPGAARRRISPL